MAEGHSWDAGKRVRASLPWSDPLLRSKAGCLRTGCVSPSGTRGRLKNQELRDRFVFVKVTHCCGCSGLYAVYIHSDGGIFTPADEKISWKTGVWTYVNGP